MHKEVDLKLSSNYVLFIVKFCQTRSFYKVNLQQSSLELTKYSGKLNQTFCFIP